ncbi:MAG: 4-hydroxythreonine-4-phosphate dehydrogenase PdxA [Cytophagaceae bacterium]
MAFLNNTTDKPVIGISIGDFNGIGPEIIIKTLSDNRLLKLCIPVIYGSYKVFSKYKKLFNIQEELNFFQIKSIDQLNPKKVNIINCWEEDYEINPGKGSPESGQSAFIALEKAVNDIIKGDIDGLVTAPIDKANIKSDKFNFPGHTEYLAHKAGNKETLMMMVSETMKVGLITTHIPINEVPNKLNKEVLEKKFSILTKSLKKDFGITKPKIAVLGLNPHAGEQGLMGKEEEEIIKPFMEEMRQKGHLIFGPFPADGFFGKQSYKKYDAILAMYHDQGLTPFKALNFDSGVNFSAGLPFIRTSPDHGTAYDIAGKNIASDESFRQAVFMACDMVKYHRNEKV